MVEGRVLLLGPAVCEPVGEKIHERVDVARC
jgi:hypothetical protein